MADNARLYPESRKYILITLNVVIFQFFTRYLYSTPNVEFNSNLPPSLFFSIFVQTKSSTLFLPKHNNYNIKLLINIRKGRMKLHNECFFSKTYLRNVCFSSCERYIVDVLVLHTRIFLRPVQLSILFCLNFLPSLSFKRRRCAVNK